MQYQELQAHFSAIKQLLVSEKELLRQKEYARFKDFYSTFAEKWAAESSKRKPIEAPILDVESYIAYSNQVAALFLEEYQNGSEINVWSIAGLKEDEVRNTAVLGWWLDKNATHGLGSILLEQIIADYIAPHDTAILTACKNENYRVKCESLPLRERENRIDIEIEAQQFLLFWEVKINAPEGRNGQQLSDYQQLLNRKTQTIEGIKSSHLIYLTKKKQVLADLEPGICAITWTEIQHSFSKVLHRHNGNHLALRLLQQYCHYIRKFKK